MKIINESQASGRLGINLYLSLRPPGLAHLSSLLQYVVNPD